MSRVAVFGDIHGNADALKSQLIRLGMDPETYALPSDLTVIQLGDLIHRGLQNMETIKLVDTILTRQPEQWIQLIGNHEAQYVYEKLFEWDSPLDPEQQDYLLKWFEDGQMVAAAATTTSTGSEALVTHAGLVYDVWKIILGRPRSARDAAARINAGIDHTTPWLWQPGEMLLGVPHQLAGPLWASAGSELYPSWLSAEMQDVPAPFSQVHGHSSVFVWPNKWSEGGFRNNGNPQTMSKIVDCMSLDHSMQHTKLQVAGATFIGVDVGHGKRPAANWGPLVFPGTAVAPEGETAASMEWLND